MARFCETLFIILIMHYSIYAQNKVLKFDHLSVGDGLSNDFIGSIAQDSSGFMWFATEDGLNRYDGYRFTVYRHDPADSSSLSENNIQTLYVDKTGRLWIGTLGGGLNSYNPETEKFTRYRLNSNNQNGNKGNTITSIYEDKSGLLWFCVQGRGLYRLDPATNEVQHYSQSPNAPDKLNYNDALRISGTYEAGKEYIWICSWGSGIYKFDIQRNYWTQYRHDPRDPNSLCDNYIELIYTDHWGNLWLSSSWSGLDRLDTKTGRFTNYRHDPANLNSLCDNTIDAVWEKDGKLWITTMNGLSRLDIETNEFNSFFHQPSDPTSLGQNDLWTIHESKSGILWIG